MLTTGIDIVEINRIEEILEKKRDQFYGKIFTENEILYIKKKQDNSKTVAGLFATKEAVAKAVGSGIGELAWKDIEVSHNKKGKPIIKMTENLKKKLEEEGLNSIEISISHEREYAVATAICFSNPILNIRKE